ncbi:tetratricopeptide repeat protein [Tenggerimyces flavus]|uniref:Tetratricopeptide repeat protein n=1 Tax=Tenggerimyces flavus TaxID=1708749 RepID=A0ABV7YE66_9ACTN|nr:tetratricopeptide repeat protein [Tenggerimyces flavus]MBM7789738.1 tetratricopeptide (TPR) repeat protein [Tenggerimyces flavus]
MRRILLVLAACAAAVVVTLTAAIVLGPDSGQSSGENRAANPRSSTGAPGSEQAGLERAGTVSMASTISTLQTHLRSQPKDAKSWATLGIAYVEQARITGDPGFYDKADQVLRTALDRQPADNDTAAAGMGALAAARHEFTAALSWADKALTINPYNSKAQGVRTDALTELGRYDDAQQAAQRADQTHPGLSTFTRLAYQAELRGQTDTAAELLERALSSTTVPADVSFVRFQLGELARNRGAYDQAAGHYAAAVKADHSNVAAVAGQARVATAQGKNAAAVDLFTEVVAQRPEPQYLIEFADLLTAIDRLPEAKAQYATVDSWRRLAAAGGVRTDLEMALFEADHGDPDRAVEQARAEWSRRHSIHVADALAWSLHRAGNDREALAYARQAAATGFRNATFAYHRGMIEKALGLTAAARSSLKSALDLDPRFSPLHAADARTALAELDHPGAHR